MQIAVLNFPTTTLDILTLPDDIENIKEVLEEEYNLSEIFYMVSDGLDIRNFDVKKTENGYEFHKVKQPVFEKSEDNWDYPRFTEEDILNNAQYEEATYLKDINDSMELDSEPTDLAYLKNTIITRSGEKLTVDASIRVQGEVRVFFKGEWYRNASKMPKELIECYHKGIDPTKLDPDYIVDDNNWFEKFVRISSKNGVIFEDSYVIDDVKGMKEGLAESITECLNNNLECLGTFFKENDVVLWDDPDVTLSNFMNIDDLVEYKNRQFHIIKKSAEYAFISDGYSEIETNYSELLLEKI